MRTRTVIRSAIITAVVGASFAVAGCRSTKTVEYAEKDQVLEQKSQATKAEFLQKDPTIQQFFDDSEGYVIFPSIGKGGVIVGGASGTGVVYDDDSVIGYSNLTQATIGAQIGGQSYSEIIFFQTDAALDRFKSGKWEGSAAASAVIGQAGAASANNYRNGVAVFVMGSEGAMVEAAVGGQKFKYLPLEK